MYPSQQLKYENYKAWSDYLSRFPWQWLATLTFDKKCRKESWFRVGNLNPIEGEKIVYYSGRKLFNKWRLCLINKEKLRLGSYLLSSYKKDYLHFHALLLGRNRYGKTLLECSHRQCALSWPYHARIKIVNEVEKAADYVAAHFMGFKSDYASIDSYDSTLLRQSISLQRDGFDNFDGLLTN